MYTLAYISLSGNTKAFVTKLAAELGGDVKFIDVKEIVKSGQEFPTITEPFVAFLPTYLEGGNGIDTGDVEILTTPFREMLAANGNHKQCLGIVGSGNKNFNQQYCLTAVQYSEQFGFPVLDMYEMRGLQADVTRITEKVKQAYIYSMI